jgi:hypothetical protein
MNAVGAVNGLGPAAVATRLIRSLPFDVSPVDRVALCAAPVMLSVAPAATALTAISAIANGSSCVLAVRIMRSHVRDTRLFGSRSSALAG